MGTWDIGHFDNDTAADFSGDLDDLPEGERAGLLFGKLREVAGTGDAYLDSDIAVEAVAAAALIAAQCPGGEPVATPYGPDEPLPELPAELRPLAVEALDRVLTEPSELLELWGETEYGEPWKAGVVALRNVLTAAGTEQTSLGPGRR
ncbi:DUF4259 domain-containing protein [Streptomyces sp. QHH-9511]|uniref:DUF4259 domain-containing protein n=1 Tax=Streptomyces sp. QHH-9511 TaxID=2684468 RepID=UPI00131705FA|nr:DUF4259 domain-containing protein [Streptomyces sp. QHH-9511]QGZ48700.1 DUF4259 domain-containing protein [Streptomyces sp. QHH-9511]